MNQKIVNAIIGIVFILLIAVIVFLVILIKKPDVLKYQQEQSSSVTQPQPFITQEFKTTDLSTNPIIDGSTGWQKYDYAKRGFKLSIPRDWNNKPLSNNVLLLSDGKNQITVSILGDQPGRLGTLKQDVENILTLAVSKEAPTNSLSANTYIKEELLLGSNTVYKIYNPAYLKGEAGSGYDFRLKDNAGFLEFIVSKGSDEAIAKSILEKVEIL